MSAWPGQQDQIVEFDVVYAPYLIRVVPDPVQVACGRYVFVTRGRPQARVP
jgi:hypothetical protein